MKILKGCFLIAADGDQMKTMHYHSIIKVNLAC